jgi:hypothetical protein
MRALQQLNPMFVKVPVLKIYQYLLLGLKIIELAD